MEVRHNTLHNLHPCLRIYGGRQKDSSDSFKGKPESPQDEPRRRHRRFVDPKNSRERVLKTGKPDTSSTDASKVAVGLVVNPTAAKSNGTVYFSISSLSPRRQGIGAGEFLIELHDLFIARQFFDRLL